MKDERLEEIRRRNADPEWAPDRQECTELLAEVDRLRAAAELVQVALENNHMAMVVLVYGRELGLWK